MEQTQFTTTILTASDGFYITQTDDTIALKDRIIATKVALGKFDSADNYKEITIEEGDDIKKLQQEEMEKEHEAEMEKMNHPEIDEIS